jgi:hypothetical protein
MKTHQDLLASLNLLEIATLIWQSLPRGSSGEISPKISPRDPALDRLGFCV